MRSLFGSLHAASTFSAPSGRLPGHAARGGGVFWSLLCALAGGLQAAALAWPLQASAHDLRLLALLGSMQLALPCLLVVRLSRVLPAPEIALLALLEVLFGVAWAWLGAGERPPASVLVGGALVLGALVANDAFALRSKEST